MNKKIKKLAFTLCEILIVLGIIGVIAEITIPTLMQNIAKQQYVVGLQKAYSNTQQMFKMYMADQGVNSLGDTDLINGSAFASTSVQDIVDAMVRKYFKVTKVCRADTGDTSCQETVSYLTKSGSFTTFISSYYNFYTVDGMKMFFYLTPSCSASSTSCGGVFVDVNGDKSPNKEGRDFMVMGDIGPDGSIYPRFSQKYSTLSGNSAAQYWKNTSSYCGPDDGSDVSTWGSVNGNGCTARIIDKGWVMDY